MKLAEVFQVYRNHIENNIQNIDGRALDDIGMDDVLLVCKDGVDNGEVLKILDIISYGKKWETLSKGMTARIRCLCGEEIKENEMIFKKRGTGNGT